MVRTRPHGTARALRLQLVADSAMTASYMTDGLSEATETVSEPGLQGLSSQL